MNESISINVSVNTFNSRPISPYIYGINEVPPAGALTAAAYRLGGNRTTGYNWENNLSNAGSDWHHYNDEYLVPKDKDGSIPAITITDFVENAKKNGAYALITLPMAGYVSNDNLRTVTPEETAPSARFAQIVNRKNRPLSLAPDLKDAIVYQDEFINYLLHNLGSSRNGGINGYSLDNEPALWSFTHPRIHPEKTKISELLEKSIALSSVVKDLDPDAEVFGPALYGVGAYATFQDAPDWKGGYANNYKWFIDAYLEGMRKAEEENKRRLLDVLDIHYYSEARCPFNHRVTEDTSNNDKCLYTRLQSPRTLWDRTFSESSWVNTHLRNFLPVLPVINESIQNYYPGTKLAITEYNFGYQNHVTGGIAQADALGIFAANDVYFASMWPLSNNRIYAYAGINLYTNYDGKGSSFGNTLSDSTTDDIENSSVYASTDKEGILHIILLNKNIRNACFFSINIQSNIDYKSFTCYGFNAQSPYIKNIGSGAVGGKEANVFNYEIPPLSAYHLVLTP
jgi:hypothetical protein